MTHRIVGIFLVAAAALVGVHTVIDPLYHTSTPESPYSPQWTWINYITAAGIVLGAAYSAVLKRRAPLEQNAPVTKRYLSTRALFVGFVFVGILFFYNWFSLLNMAVFKAPDTIGAATSILWLFVDAGFPALAGYLGCALFCQKTGIADGGDAA